MIGNDHSIVENSRYRDLRAIVVMERMQTFVSPGFDMITAADLSRSVAIISKPLLLCLPPPPPPGKGSTPLTYFNGDVQPDRVWFSGCFVLNGTSISSLSVLNRISLHDLNGLNRKSLDVCLLVF